MENTNNQPNSNFTSKPNPNQKAGNNTKGASRKKFLTIFIVLLLVIGAGFFIYYQAILSKEVSSDNAYVNGNIVNVTSAVSGTVVAINADNTSYVKAGEKLITLDPTDANLALSNARSALAGAVKAVSQKYANAKASEALVASKQLELQKAEEDYSRRVTLAKKHIISEEEFSHARLAVEIAKKSLLATIEQAKTAEAFVKGVPIIQHPDILQAKTRFIEAWVANRRNVILAPVSGYVASRSVQVGNRINPGSPLLSIIDLDRLWIDANLKESQLKNVRIGQPVIITTDLYGSKVKYHGEVVGLAAGTGSAFSLLPAQNATGSWIKIIQRVPVKISINQEDLKKHPLRIGLSTSIKIDVSNTNGSVLSNPNPDKAIIYTTTAAYQPIQEAVAEANQIINQYLDKGFKDSGAPASAVPNPKARIMQTAPVHGGHMGKPLPNQKINKKAEALPFNKKIKPNNQAKPKLTPPHVRSGNNKLNSAKNPKRSAYGLKKAHKPGNNLPPKEKIIPRNKPPAFNHNSSINKEAVTK